MKKLSLAALAAGVILGVPVFAQAAFSSGDLVVYRVGTGTAALTSASTAVSVDEFTPAGVPVQSIALPIATSGSTNALTASGTASSEGELTLSGNGQYLLLTGYASAPGTASIASSTSAAVPRVIGRIDASGNINTTTTTTAFSANNPRSAASQDGLNLFVAGANSGVISLSLGSTGTAGTAITTASSNNRQLELYNGQLYVSTSSGTTYRIAAVGSGIPTGPDTLTEVPGIAVGTTTTATVAGSPVAGPYGYAFASLLGGSSPDTLYVADNSYSTTMGASSTIGAIEKFTLTSGSYVFDGAVNLAGLTGLIGSTSLVAGVPTETLYATTPSGIYDLTDSGSGALTNSPALLVSAGTNEAFRGIAFAPSAAVPEPGSLALLGIAGATLMARRRRA